MGRSTSSEICPNVARLGIFKNLMNHASYEDDDPDFDPMEWGVIRLPNGWEHVQMSVEFGRLYVDNFEKGNLAVQLVNTALYSNGGEQDWVVFSENRSAVEAFLKDQDIQVEIVEEEAVSQTL